MKNRNIIQEIIDGYMALKARQKNNISYEDIPYLTIETAFWLMRITGEHYASLQKSLNPEISTKQVEKVVTNIQKEIFRHFSNFFAEDFQAYTLGLIDDLYKHIGAVKPEWERASNNASIDAGIIEEISSLIDEITHLYQSISAFKEDFQSQFPSIFIDGIFPSSIMNIHSYAQQKRNDPLFYTQNENLNGSELWNKFRRHANSLMESVEKLQENVIHIFCLNDLCTGKMISNFTKERFPNIAPFLISIQYPASIHFNLESTLIFMFLDTPIPDDVFMISDNKSLDKAFICLIRKYETFFNKLYTHLRIGNSMIDTILFPMDATDHEEALEGYISAPANDQFLEKRLSVLQLKKLIALQRFYTNISKSTLPQDEEKLLDRFDILLSYTKMPYIAYNPILDNLPEYVIDTLGITQTDLSKILGVNKSTISRQRDNNTLIKKNKWFWIAAAGYTYEYLNGETTIPFYGKPTDKYGDKYLMAPASILAHGEIFLKRITHLKDYRIRLSKTNSKRKTNLLSKEHLQKISSEAIFLAEHLKKCRDYIDALCENERNKQVELSVNNNEEERIIFFSNDATQKLISYLKIFDRMLDAMHGSHIVERVVTLNGKKESHPLEPMSVS